MNKRKLHHAWTRWRAVRPWYFLILAVASGVICIFALRANNQHMSELRGAVYAADKNGADVQKPLRELQAYVTHHMNTNLAAGNTSVYPPIQLKYSYERLTQGGQSAASSELYSQAQAYCEQQNRADFSGRNRVPCIEQYVESHGGTKAPVNNVPEALYKFDFVTPRWSPDLAGWSLLALAVSGLLFIFSLLTRWWFRHQLNK
jgi:hypothetical protein